ncbi:dienelactone hydrolase family protein [Pseudonocardia bannensis]|uniref:Dienelactone hydrolase family protein n=1 Tax=Pseudonocardia bannensis TaxID=630973 RepID=A0A848DB38_9PSEU|nr:dienelactone hydrolase family protein [Pseudonocardia bannensis]NMH90032.1 dienelactone hydrolase family protein [Pseudonocardia bannensis]
MVFSRYEQVEAHDGGVFDAFCARPDRESGPAILLFQEIFGINDNIRGLAERLAEAGYLTLAPDMFWRIEPRFERNDESGLADGMAMVQQLDWASAGADITSAFAHVLSMPECSGTVGGVGFCLGGTLTYVFATSTRVDGRGPDAAVSYYGSGIQQMLGQAGSIECPMMFHYGNRDPYIPEEQITAVEAAVKERPGVTIHRYDAGHAFSNWDAPSMYDKEAADLAWSRTLGFFADHL